MNESKRAQNSKQNSLKKSHVDDCTLTKTQIYQKESRNNTFTSARALNTVNVLQLPRVSYTKREAHGKVSRPTDRVSFRSYCN